MLLRWIPRGADCSRWPVERHTVLFINFWPLFYRETFQAVGELLADRDRVSSVVLSGKQPTPSIPTRSRIQFHALAGHVVPSVLARARDHKQSVFRAESVLCPELPGILRRQGNLPWSVLRPEFKWLFKAEFPRLALQVAMAEHILDHHRPALVVSPDDADRGRIYTLLAKSRNIPSMVVQQGMVTENAVEWQCLTSDGVAVFGPRSRDALRRHDVPPAHIHVTGCPRLDVLTRLDPEAERQVHAELRVPAGLSLVLLASQPYVAGSFSGADARREMLQAVGKAVAAVKNVFLAVKPHPTEDERELRSMIGTGPRIRYVDRQADIRNFIRACDVFVTFFSTSSMQALMAGKPIIRMRFPGSGVNNSLFDGGAMWTAGSTGELIDHLRLLTGIDRERAMAERAPVLQRFTYELLYQPDGQAATRVADLLLSLMKTAK